MRNPVLRCFCFLLLGLLAVAICSVPVTGATLSVAATGDARPNIAVFILDDVGQSDIGVFGNPVIRTPTIDRLAREGMRFDNAFLTTSSCTASRASILTGLYPHNTGAPGLGDTLPASVESLPQLLKNAGYYTASVGKWHLGEPFKAHFDRVVEMRDDSGAIDWLPELAQRPVGQPFFFWFASHDAHVPYDWHPPLKSYSPDQVLVHPWSKDAPYERAMLVQYYNEITRADHSIDTVIQAMEAAGVMDNTIVIVLSDNGTTYGSAKTSLYDEGLKTPLIIRFPKRIAAGGVNPQIVSSVDLMPTLLSAAGIQIPSGLPGASLWPTLADSHQPVHTYVVAERNKTEEPLFERALRTTDFLYKRNYLGRRLCDPTNGLLLGTRQRGRVYEEFYDMKRDPLAHTNLIHHHEFQPDISLLRQTMNDLMHTTADVPPSLILEQCPPLPWGSNIELQWPIDSEQFN